MQDGFKGQARMGGAGGPATQVLETSGPTILDIGAIADGQGFKRVGSTVVGVALVGSDEKAGVSSADTTPGYLGTKIVTTAGHVTLTIVNPASNETLRITLPNVGPGAATTGTAGVTSITTDAQGRITAIAIASYALQSTSITAGSGLSGGGDFSTSRTISMPAVGPGATTTGTAGVTSITTDAQGRITAIATASYALQSTTITAGAGLSGGGDFSTSRTISMPAVGPGATTTGTAGVTSITTDAQGRVTAIATATYLTAAAPVDAQYLALATNATLTVERVFTPSTGLTAVDGGAGSAYTLTNNLSTGVAAASQTAIFSTNANGRGVLQSTSNATRGGFDFGTTPVLKIEENLTVASATSAVLDIFAMQAVTVTVTLTNAITTATGFDYFTIKAPTISAASAVNITACATFSVQGPPVLAGSATATALTAARIAGTWVNTANTGNCLRLSPDFVPTSGTAAFNALSIGYSINQTGGANGTITGINVNATETALIGTHDLMNLQISSASRFKVASPSGTTAVTLTGTGAATLAFATTSRNFSISLDNTGGVTTFTPNSAAAGFLFSAAGALATLNSTSMTVPVGVTGSTSASGNLLLASTTNATKGLIQIGGSTGMIYNEATQRLGIGAAPTAGTIMLSGLANPLVTMTSNSNSGAAGVDFRNADNTARVVITSYGSSDGSTTFGASRNSTSAFRAVVGRLNIGTDTAADLVFGTQDVERFRVISTGNLQFTAVNFVLDTTTGTKIGTATTQKLGFWNVTPVIQPAAITAPTGGAIIDAESRVAIGTLITRLQTLGLTA